MMASSHDVWAHEELTDFCGPELCREQHPPGCPRSMAAPPQRHERRRRPCRPARQEPCRGYLRSTVHGRASVWASRLPIRLRTTHTDDEAAVYDDLPRISANSRATLHFDSSTRSTLTFPGMPCPAVCAMRATSGLRGKGSWGDDQHVVDLAHQAHMLQTGYVDSQLVRFLDLIRDTSWYDDALVMVMADHGIAFTAGDVDPRWDRRRISTTSLMSRCSSRPRVKARVESMTVPQCCTTLCPPSPKFSKSSRHGRWKASRFSMRIPTASRRECSRE